MNYKLTISFDGSNYSGWQFQKNAPTIQGVMTERSKEFFSDEVSVTGCSRTDSKVHAENYVLNLRTKKEISTDAVIRGMNTLLPDDIVIKDCEIADEDFHARYDCKKKEYTYRILNCQTRNPFLKSRVLHFKAPLDVEKMNEDASFMVGKHDFTSFMAQGSKITDAVREVYSAKVEKEGNIITFTVSANGFLYNMVRIMVGTLIDSNLGRTKKSISEIIEAKNRSEAGFTASPEGLYLTGVYY